MPDDVHVPGPEEHGEAGRTVGKRRRGEPRVDSLDDPVVVLTSNFTIGPLFSRGCLLPPSLEDPDHPSPDSWNTLKHLRGRLPRAWGEDIARMARNVFPIGLVLKGTRSVARIASNVAGSTIEAVRLADVERIAFRCQGELERCCGLEYSNYDTNVLARLAVVDAGVFDGDDAQISGAAGDATADRCERSREDDDGTPRHAPRLESVRDAIRLADCRAALVAYLCTSSPGKHEWIRGLDAVLSGKHGHEAMPWPGPVVRAIAGRDPGLPPVETALLTAVVRNLPKLPVEAGWPADAILRDVSEEATRRLRERSVDSSAEVHAVELWRSRALDVLSSRAEPQSMSDDAYRLQRSLLLLLLRGDLDSIHCPSPSHVGTHGPGPIVQGIAGLLAAYRTGLRAMPTRYKQSATGSTKWLEYLGDVFMGFVGNARDQELVPVGVPAPKAKYRAVKALQGEWVVALSREEIARLPRLVDPALEELLARGRQLGFDFRDHGEEELVASVSRPGGKSLDVYIQILPGRDVGKQMVRFYTKPLDARSPSRAKKISRDVAVRLLQHNAESDMSCRFAIDGNSHVVVLADQLLATLDHDEFRHHVAHVAEVADKFERDREGNVT